MESLNTNICNFSKDKVNIYIFYFSFSLQFPHVAWIINPETEIGVQPKNPNSKAAKPLEKSYLY